MPPCSQATARLVPHPRSAEGPLRAIGVEVRRTASRLWLRYRLEGDLDRVVVPPPAAPRFALRLWERSCVEAFVAAAGAEAYHEMNFSPSGEWAVFAFSAYRVLGALDGDLPPPRLTVRSGADALVLEVAVSLEALAPAYAAAPLDIGLSAVVESVDGGLSYWSLAHPPGDPDFHHASTRALRLPAMRQGENE